MDSNSEIPKYNKMKRRMLSNIYLKLANCAAIDKNADPKNLGIDKILEITKKIKYIRFLLFIFYIILNNFLAINLI